MRFLALCLGLVVLATSPGVTFAGSAPPAKVTVDQDDDLALWYSIGVGGDVSSAGDLELSGAMGQSAGFCSADEGASLLSGFYALGASEDSIEEIVAPLAVGPGAVTEFSLLPIRPNPSHGVAYVGWTIPRASSVRVTVHDVQGREVAVLADGEQSAGRYVIRWKPSSATSGAAAGMYFIRLRTSEGDLVRRLVVVP